jgi:hypothetical protein
MGRNQKPANWRAFSQAKPNEERKRSNNGSDGNEPPDLHPFVQSLLKELPKAGSTHPA